MPVRIPHSGARKRVAEEYQRDEHSRSAKWAAISLVPEKRRTAHSRASALHDWLRRRQHTGAWHWPGGSYIWPISSQPLQWLSTPLRACWNNIIRTCKCWRPPCPLPAQNSESEETLNPTRQIGGQLQSWMEYLAKQRGLNMFTRQINAVRIWSN